MLFRSICLYLNLNLFPDIEELITGIIRKDLNLGISISSINKIIKNLDECFVNDQSSKHKVINIFKYK